MEKIAKNVIRAASIAAMLFFFIPAFSVSCSSETIDMSAAHLVIGYETEEGMTLCDPVPSCMLLFIFPLVILILAMMESLPKGSIFLGSAVLAGCELGGWVMLVQNAEEKARENYCGYSTEFGFYIDVLLMVAVILFGLIGLMSEESPGESINITDDWPNKGGYHPVVPNYGGWTCPGCGNKGSDTTEFCFVCGHKRPLSSIVPPVEGGTRGGDLDDPSTRPGGSTAGAVKIVPEPPHVDPPILSKTSSGGGGFRGSLASRVNGDAGRPAGGSTAPTSSRPVNPTPSSRPGYPSAESVSVPVNGSSWGCPRCGKTVPGTAGFCGNCGAKKPVTYFADSSIMDNERTMADDMPKRCSGCGCVLSPGAMFCSQCGKPV